MSQPALIGLAQVMVLIKQIEYILIEMHLRPSRHGIAMSCGCHDNMYSEAFESKHSISNNDPESEMPCCTRKFFLGLQ